MFDDRDRPDAAAPVTAGKKEVSAPARAPEDAADLEYLKSPALCPAGFVVLAPGHKIRISGVSLAAFDLDETLVEGTGEAVHDGAEARFAYAVRTSLQFREVEFDAKEWKRIWEIGENGDGGYRSLTGRAERQVLEALAERVNREFGHFFGGWGPVKVEDLGRLSNVFLAEFSTQYASQIREIQGVSKLVNGIKEAGVLLALCTASSPEFVLALEDIRRREDGSRFNFLGRFDIVVTNAEKKVAEHSYRKEPVERICDQSHTPAGQCVMFGDSMSDIATAALNDIPLVVIRFHGTPPEQEEQREILQKALLAARTNHPELASNTTVVIVGHYDQVVVDPYSQVGAKTAWSIGRPADLGLEEKS